VAVIVTPGDKLVLRNGSPTGFSRPSLPYNLFFNGRGSVGIAGGSLSYQDIYEQQVWVYTTVNKLARQIARLPLKVYRRRDDGERERLRDHPLAVLLSKPMERRGAIWLKQKIAYPALINGNATFLKITEQGAGATVVGLMSLDWRWMNPILTEDGRLLAWQIELQDPSVPRFLSPDAVLHFAWDTGVGDIGASPLKALARTIRIEDSSQRYQSSSFENGVRHSAVYALPEGADLDADEREEMRQSVQATQGGVDKAFGLAIAYGGGTITPLSHTAVEAELIEQRKLNREEVAAAYDVPPVLIGILDNATYSNVAEMHRMLYGMVLGPWLNLIEDTIQAQLIDSYRPWAVENLYVEFELAEVLKSDTLKEVQAIREGIATGILTPNEGREIRNMPRSRQEGMDDFYLPGNNLSPVGEPTVDSEDATVPTAVASQIRKAAHRIERKDPRGVDAARVERELAVDLDDPHAAREWASRIEQAGTPDAIRALLTV